METVNIADWFLVAFTIVIAGSTIVYTVGAWRLLKQARNAFLADVLIRTLQTAWEMHKKTGPTSTAYWKYVDGVKDAVRGVDQKLGRDFEKAWSGRWETTRRGKKVKE